MKFALHGVIKGVGDDSPIQGLHRIVWLNEKTNQLFAVRIPTWNKDEPVPRYYKGPKEYEYAALGILKLGGHIVETQVAPHVLAGMTDEQIRKRYPQRKRQMKTKRARTDCAVLQFRDDRWKWVEPICRYIDEHRADAFETDELGRLVKERALQVGRTTVEIYDAVHRVLAHAAGKNSILSGHCLCGGKGKTRTPRRVQKLGRHSAAYVKGEVPSPGIHLNDEDKRFIVIGHSKFLKQGRSVQEAYYLTMGAWWSTGYRIEDGVDLPILKPAHERPTLPQFRYWGPRDPEGKSAFELLLKNGEWEREFRAMIGSAMHGLNGVGQMAVVDATGIHLTFVSMLSQLDALGQGHRIVVHDGLNEVITGFYVGLEAPGGRTANLAIYNSALDKVDLFARFGLKITTDQVPACFYRKFRSDNGEFRNVGTMQVLNGMGSALELVERRRAERKPQAEAGHHSMQVLLDDRLDGATRGKSPDRGEDHSAVPACWTWYDYMVEFLRAVIYFNCHADASSLMARHPFRAEMLRDDVPPNRAAMFAWCVRNNKIAIPAHDTEILKAKLLPVYRAVVKQSGIYLLRPDRGDKAEIVRGPRFSGRRAMELRWHEGTHPDFPIDVHMDPNDPNRVWYVDELGIHVFDNLSDDQATKREANMQDLLAMQDKELVSRTVGQSAADQQASDFISHRENKNLAFREAKKAQIKATGGKVSKRRLKSDLSVNRARETGLIANMLDPVLRAPRLQKKASNAPDSVTALGEPSNSTTAQEGHSVPGNASTVRVGTDQPTPPTQPSTLPSNSVARGGIDNVIAASLAALSARRKRK